MLQSPNTQRENFLAAKTLGDKLFSSDAILVPELDENMFLLFKEFPMPVISTGEAAEAPMPHGAVSYETTQIKTYFQGQVSIADTTKKEVEKFLAKVMSNKGKFNAWLYEGTKQKYAKAYYLEDMSISLDAVGRDTEARQQLLYITGTTFFHYFGVKDKAGNLDS